jgi:late competence protein required for DNA uptake (superfamily II DNA/RNA helicase)
MKHKPELNLSSEPTAEHLTSSQTIAKPLVISSNILVHKKDFKIEQSKMIVEHFIWDCPNCTKQNKTLEFYVDNKKLWCSNCMSEFTYQW